MTEEKENCEYPFSLLEKDSYQVILNENLFIGKHEEYETPDKFINDDRWNRSTQILFNDSTILWKQLTDKTYCLTLKTKQLYSIPQVISKDKRCARVSQLILAVNRMREVPNGMAVFVQLRNCSLDRNKLRDLKPEFGTLTSIENLDMGNNQLKTIPKAIFELKYLKVLRLSVNEIEELPQGFARLTQLENLRIGSNRLRCLPQDFGQCQSLRYLKLASNRLTDFPRQILDLCNLEQLLLSTNKIRVIPLELFDNESLQMFHAEGNPLQQPPIEVINRGLANIREYCRAFKKGDIKDDRLKVMFLGATEAGKTTLCQAITQGKSNDNVERTVGIEQHQYEIRDVKMVIWDFAGHLVYYQTHHVFITSDALVILVINLSKYDSTQSCYDDLVGLWLDNVSMRVPNAVILVVGTHIDEVKENGEDPKDKVKDILTKMKTQVAKRKDVLTARIKQLQEKEHNLGKDDTSPGDVKEQQENILHHQIIQLKDQAEQQLQVQLDTPLLVCSKEPNTEGLQTFKDALVRIALDEKLFPERGKNRPKSWKETENLIMEERKITPGDKGEESRTGMRNIDNFVDLIIDKIEDMDRPEHVHTVLQYLHNLGQVIWFDNIDGLKDYIFINPPILIDIFKMVIRHQQDKNLEDKQKKWRELMECNLTKTKFELYLRKFKEEGFINHKLLYMLWKKLPAKEFEVEWLVKILEQFELCFTGDDTTVTSYKSLNPTVTDFKPKEVGQKAVMGDISQSSPSSQQIPPSANPVQMVAGAIPRSSPSSQQISPSANPVLEPQDTVPVPISSAPHFTPYHPPGIQYYNQAGNYPAESIPSQSYRYPYQVMPPTSGMFPQYQSPQMVLPQSQMYNPYSNVPPSGNGMGYTPSMVPENYQIQQGQYPPHMYLPQPQNTWYPQQQSPWEPPLSQHQGSPEFTPLQTIQSQEVSNGHYHGNIAMAENSCYAPSKDQSDIDAVSIASTVTDSMSTLSVDESDTASLSETPMKTKQESTDSGASIKDLTTSRKKRVKPEKKFSLFPCYLPDDYKLPETLWPERRSANEEEITVKFELFPVKPRGFFERLLVRCHWKEVHIPFLQVYRKDVILRERAVDALISIQHENDEDLILKTRSIKTNVSRVNMWHLILKVYGLISTVLELWPGVRFESYTLCPSCLDSGIQQPYPFEFNLPGADKSETTYKYYSEPQQCRGQGYCGRKIEFGLVQPISKDETDSRGEIPIQNYYNFQHCHGLMFQCKDSTQNISIPKTP